MKRFSAKPPGNTEILSWTSPQGGVYEGRFAYGDVVTVDVNGNSYEMPVCSNYNDVDTSKMLVRATKGASSVIVAINYGQLAVNAGLAKPQHRPRRLR